MGGTALKKTQRFFSQNGGGTDASLTTRVETLEQNAVRITYFASISSASGTITKPTGSTILADPFFAGADALVATIVNTKPTGTLPQTAGGVDVTVTSFDTSGNYVLSGTPGAFPVALIYVITILAKDYGNLTIANIIDEQAANVGLNEVALGTTNGLGSTSNLKFDTTNGFIVNGLTGTTKSAIREWVTVNAGYASLYLGNITPAVGNPAITSNGTAATRVNGVSQVTLDINTTNVLDVRGTYVEVKGVPLLVSNKSKFGDNNTPTAFVHILGSSTSASSLRIMSGVAPTSPNDGDIWYDGTDLKMRVGGTTKTFTLT